MNNTTQNDAESDILFSKKIKAGQRIYYVDVKKNKREEMYMCITESKKLVSGTEDMPQVSYEKHKVFLFQEDFEKFQDSINEAMNYIKTQQGETQQRPEDEEEIKIDIEF